MKHRLLIYTSIGIVGVVGIVLSITEGFSTELEQLLLSIGTGLFTAALTGLRWIL